MENQDFVFSAENESAAFFAVADGVSACKNSRLGAQIACEVSGDILLDHVRYYFDSAAEKVKAILLMNIRSAISKSAKKEGFDPEDYASTLSFVCFDKQTNRVMTFSLGDSRIYRVRDNELINLNKTVVHECNMVCSTISYSAENEAVICKTERNADDTFLLCTDGMWKTAEISHLFDNPESLNDGDEIVACLNQYQIGDDCSFLLTA